MGPWGEVSCLRSYRKEVSGRTGFGSQHVSNCYPYFITWHGEHIPRQSGRGGIEGLKEENSRNERLFHVLQMFALN